MQIVKYVCNRCKREMSGNKRGYISMLFRNENGLQSGLNEFQEHDFCERCMSEIMTFIFSEPMDILVENTEEPVVKKKVGRPRKYEEPIKAKKPTIDIGKIKALSNAGWTINNIAVEMNLDIQTTAEIVRRIAMGEDLSIYQEDTEDNSDDLGG